MLATTVEGALIILFIIFLSQGLYGQAEDNFVRDMTKVGTIASGDATKSSSVREQPDVLRDKEAERRGLSAGLSHLIG